MNIRIEVWNGHRIRFVEKEPGDWWAVAKDVSTPLEYPDSRQMTRYLDKDEVDSFNWKKKQTADLAVHFPDYKYNPNVPVISETGIYEAIFNSKHPEAAAFKKWVKQMLRQLRQIFGFEGFQIFRMLDKEHQIKHMSNLNKALKQPKREHFIKANVITDKAVSTKFGHPKMLKKDQMTPEMLVHRQPILEDTVNLMAVKDKFGLELSISETIYGKYSH